MKTKIVQFILGRETKLSNGANFVRTDLTKYLNSDGLSERISGSNMPQLVFNKQAGRYVLQNQSGVVTSFSEEGFSASYSYEEYLEKLARGIRNAVYGRTPTRITNAPAGAEKGIRNLFEAAYLRTLSPGELVGTVSQRIMSAESPDRLMNIVETIPPAERATFTRMIAGKMRTFNLTDKEQVKCMIKHKLDMATTAEDVKQIQNSIGLQTFQELYDDFSNAYKRVRKMYELG